MVMCLGAIENAETASSGDVKGVGTGLVDIMTEKDSYVQLMFTEKLNVHLDI